MPSRRRPKPFEQGATSKSVNNGNNNRSSPANAKARQKPPQSPGFAHATSSWRKPKNVSNPDYKSKIETLWKKMGFGRTIERQTAIKNGLIADPNKRTTLAKAIRVVGTCQDMCPEFERIQRIRENAIDRAEKVTLHGGAKVADEAKMVKAFHRPDAGKEEQLPSDLRPPAVLQSTARYVLYEVASPASSLAEHHKFVWDRTRCIRNDFTIQASGKLEDIKMAIQSYEEIARFHILSLHQMPKIGKHDYDAQQELEQLSATLLTLFEYYDDNRSKYEAPCEAEFRAYKLLIDIRSTTNDALERVQTWPIRVRDSLQVQTAIQLYHASGNTITDTSSMLSPYARSVQIEAAQYARFWSIMESSNVDYLMACAAAVSFNEIRARSLETMAKVYRSGPTSRLHDLTLDELTFSLGLDSKSQTKSLLSKAGLTISRHANGTAYLDLDELSGPFPKNAIATADQMFSRSIVEVKRQDRVFSAIYKGLTFAYCKENGLIDESDGDADFEPDPEDLDSEDEQNSLFVDDMEEDEPSNDVSSKLSTDVAQLSDTNVPAQPRPQPGLFLFPKTSATSSPGNIGQLSGLETSSPAPASSNSATNPFIQPTQFTSPFTKSGVIPGIFSGSNTANMSFGQPSVFSAKAAQPLESSVAASAPTEVNSMSGNPFMSAVSTTKSAEVPPSSLFQWTPATKSQEPLSQAPFSSAAASSGAPEQPAKLPITNTAQSTAEGLAKAPLHPFVFPSITPPTVQSTSFTPSKEPQTTLFKMFSETETSGATVAPLSKATQAPAFSNPRSQSQTPSVSVSPSNQMSAEQAAPERENSAVKPSIQPSSTPPTLGLKSLEAATKTSYTESNSNIASLSSKPAPLLLQDAKTLVPIQPTITQEQIDRVLESIAKDLFLGQYGILEQFIEARMGPIYDKVQRKVVKERIEDRLATIKQSLVQSKFFYLWRWRIDEKLQKKKVVQRRERMRQTQRESLSATPTDDGTRGSVDGGSVSPQVDGQLKYLTRGFQETFGKPTPSRASSIQREALPTSHVASHRRDSVSGKAPSMISAERLRDRRYMRHSYSRSVDGLLQVPPKPVSSSSMPPPSRSPGPNLPTRSESSKPKPFIGGVYLQDESLRREAINLARRTGAMTTTESDYFRLKARNIDPDTKSVPWTRKRGRDSEGKETNGLLSKSRRFSESTTSGVPASQSPPNRSLTMISKETGPQPPNSQSRTTTPRLTAEEDAIFAAAQKLRETLAEDTEWMRKMREDYERECVAPDTETAAQRKLREFKMIPSKTSIRLRQTFANGLLPVDYFDRQSSERSEAKKAKATVEVDFSATPTPKTGLAALPQSRNKHQNGINAFGALSNRGTSADDAIEL